MKLSMDQFEQLVIESLDDLPPFFMEQMDNIEILIEKWPSKRDLKEAGVPPGDTLLGLYSGIPLTERTQAYNMVVPDTITLYQGPIEQFSVEQSGRSYLDQVRAEVRHTIIHEIAHHFGISDDRLREIGAY